MYHYEMLEELDPLGPMESMLADRIISLSWRLKRTMRIQDETIEALCTPKPPSPLDKLTKSLIYKSIGQSPPDQPESKEPPTLGQVAMKDFSYARVLDRLMMYERRIENSLYKTINELQKLKLIRKIDRPRASRPKTSSQSLRTDARSPHLSFLRRQESINQNADNVGLNQLSNNDQRLTAAVNMQNKPNFQNAKTDLTSYTQNNYNQNPPLPTPQKQTHFGSRRAGNVTSLRTQDAHSAGNSVVLKPRLP